MIIDCDSHIMPRNAFAHAAAKFPSRAPVLQFDDTNLFVDLTFSENPAVEMPGATPLPVKHGSHGLSYRGNSDLDARLADYDRMGVDAHFALPQLTGWWNYLIKPDLAVAIAHSWNLALLDMMRQHPSQVLGVALLPLQDVEASIREARWAKAEGFPAVLMDYVYPVAEHPYGTTLASHPELWPLFATIEELGLPIFLHAVQHGHRVLNVPRFTAHGLDLCAPSDSQLNLVSLITSGLLDDFPQLKMIHAETGTAYIKSLAQLMDARFEHVPIRFDEEGFTSGSRRRANATFQELREVPPTIMREKNKQYPSHYFRNNFYWTIETEEAELADVVQFLGAERFLFATDYPHNDPGGRMKFQDVELLRDNPRITDTDKEAIRTTNAQALFSLG